MRYKIGNRVRVKSLSWYNENKDENGCVYCGDGMIFCDKMQEYCGKIMTISRIKTDPCDPDRGHYLVKENPAFWTDKMFEGLAEEGDLMPKFGEYSDNELLDVPTMTTEFVKEHGFPCPNGYIFKDENGNVINATKIVLEKKKKEYPKTFEECVHVLEGENRMSLELMNTFRKLIDARNAYWKIAGEEMGLGKPWEPSKDKMVYSFYRHSNEIETDIFSGESVIFEFPTKEMRDAFKENFDPDIEICKEFL